MARSRLVALGDIATSMFSVEFDMSPSTVDTRMPRDSAEHSAGFFHRRPLQQTHVRQEILQVMYIQGVSTRETHEMALQGHLEVRVITYLTPRILESIDHLQRDLLLRRPRHNRGVIAPPDFSRPKDLSALTV